MNKLKLIILLLISSSCITDKETKTFETFEVKLKNSVEIFTKCRTDKLISPRSVENNKVKMVEARDWTSGFFSGELWMMYELTNNKYWKDKALEFTLPLEEEKWNGKTHDMGFKMFFNVRRIRKEWVDGLNPFATISNRGESIEDVQARQIRTTGQS